MAAVTMPDELPDSALVSAPACGSGRMLLAGIRRNRSATFLGTDSDLTCVHMTALNCLVRNANTYVIHGNSLSLETWGGFYVRRSLLGGELHRLTQEQTETLIRLPLATPEASTALSAPQALSVHEPTPEVVENLADVARAFTLDKRGRGSLASDRKVRQHIGADVVMALGIWCGGLDRCRHLRSQTRDPRERPRTQIVWQTAEGHR